MMNEKTLEYARKQLEQLRKPALTERAHNETVIEKKGQKKENEESITCPIPTT